jgi:hypothetical protein
MADVPLTPTPRARNAKVCPESLCSSGRSKRYGIVEYRERKRFYNPSLLLLRTGRFGRRRQPTTRSNLRAISRAFWMTILIVTLSWWVIATEKNIKNYRGFEALLTEEVMGNSHFFSADNELIHVWVLLTTFWTVAHGRAVRWPLDHCIRRLMERRIISRYSSSCFFAGFEMVSLVLTGIGERRLFRIRY